MGSSPISSTKQREKTVAADIEGMGNLLKAPMTLTPMSAIMLMAGQQPTGGDWKTWVLEDEAIWETDEGWVVTVPVNFMTDFASIPFLFRWWQTGSVGPQRTAAYFHDYLYSSQTDAGRRESDRVFRDVMEFVAVDNWRNKFRRNAMYYALRVGGWAAWRSNQKKYRELGSDW